MESSFSKYYDPKISTKKAYTDVQNVQSLLFIHLITDTPCSSTSMPIITINDRQGILRIKVDSLKNIGESDKRYVVGALLYSLRQGGHYGGILLDTQTKEFSIFDPSFSHLGNILPQVISYISITTGYKYVEIPCFMDFQHETTDYYCSLWTLMIMYLACHSQGQIAKIVKRVAIMPISSKKKEIEGFIHFLYKQMVETNLLKDSYKVNRFIANIVSDKNIDPDTKQYLVDSIKFSTEPVTFINALGLYNVSEEEEESSSPMYHIYINAIQVTDDKEVLDFIKKLSFPMSMPEFVSGIDMLYTKKSSTGKYLPIVLHSILKEEYPEIDMFFPALREMAYTMRFNFSLEKMKILTEKLSKSFSNFSGIPLGEYKMWNFIFEFYLRYYILDTVDAKIGDDLFQHRLKTYSVLLQRYGFEGKWYALLLALMLYSPIKYIIMDDFVPLLPKNPTSSIVASIMASKSLLKTKSSDKIYSDRVLIFLSSVV